MQYLAGYATTPDAAEPDIVDGVTDVSGVDRVYAIWKQDGYFFADGEDQSWTKGSADGLTVTVKRSGDDTMTFPCFTGVKVDGESVTDFTRREGSLILTLAPEFLEKLSVGAHTLELDFTANASVTTRFTVAEQAAPAEPDAEPETPEEPADPDAPNTGDASGLFDLLAVSALAIAVIAFSTLRPATRRKRG